MKHTATNQRGFALVETLLIILIVAIVAGTGYYVYRSYNKSNDNLNTAQTNANTATPPKKATKYLTINEWGVRAPLSGTLGLQYTLANDNKQADFTSAKLLGVDEACTAGYGGTIARYAPTDDASPDGAGGQTAKERAAKADKSTYAYIGGYYYFFDHSQAGCGDVAKSQELQQQTNDAVKALVPKLQTAPKS